MINAKDVVIVTGGSGYIGSALINKFAERYQPAPIRFIALILYGNRFRNDNASVRAG